MSSVEVVRDAVSPGRGLDGCRATFVCADASSSPDGARAVELRQLGFASADVTLFGPTPELHAFHTRARSSFSEVVRGARHLVQAGLRVGITVPVTRANVRHLSEIVDVAATLGAVAVRFSRAPGGMSEPNPAIAADQIEAAQRRAARLRLRSVIAEPAPDDEIFGLASGSSPAPIADVFRSFAPTTTLSQPAR